MGPSHDLPHLFDRFDDDSMSLPEVVSTEEIVEEGGPNGSLSLITRTVELPSIEDLETIQAQKKGKGGTIPKRPRAMIGNEVCDLNTPVHNQSDFSAEDKFHEEVAERSVKKAKNDSAHHRLPAFPSSGGIPGFSTKKPPQATFGDQQHHPDGELQAESSLRHPTGALGNGEEPTRDSSVGDTKALHEDQEAVHIGEPTSYDAVESLDTEHDGLTQEFHKKAIEISEAINRNVIVRVYTPGSSAPAFVKLQASDTVGSIVVAEHKLNTTEMPVTSLRNWILT